jgi:uncharacterized membrane protein
MFAAIICAPWIRRLNAVVGLQVFNFGVQGARAAVGMIAAAMLSFIVFFFSVLLLTVQLATVNLSPRIISRPFKSNVLKASLGLFVFTFIYGLALLARLENHVPELPVCVIVLLSVVSIGVFLFVVEYVGKELRPATVVASVAQEGLRVIRSTYPDRLQPFATRPPSAAMGTDLMCRQVRNDDRTPGVLVAFDLPRLVAFAINNQCTIELIPQVGDYVPAGGALYRIYGAESIDCKGLRDAVALGRERTMEQDPAFVFRIIVDIAEKALSASINDPTTGVQAIDQLQFLLQEVGERDLNTGTVCDADGNVRLLYRTPDWQDFVLLTVSEIRQYGANSIQIMRRLRGMLEYLIATLPASRAHCLQEQMDLLRASVEKTFFDPRDRMEAEIGDLQGLGGAIAHANR